MTIDSMTTVLDSVLNIADIHAEHVKYALQELTHRMPLSSHDIKNFTREDIQLFDSFIHRFSKLQDLMGSKLFSEVLDYSGELANDMSHVDKLYKLEKLNVLRDAKKWQNLREIRNHLSHEYPDDPGLTAKHLNEAFEASSYLLKTLDTIKAYLSRLKEKKIELNI